jgi:hypothetical protein
MLCYILSTKWYLNMLVIADFSMFAWAHIMHSWKRNLLSLKLHYQNIRYAVTLRYNGFCVTKLTASCIFFREPLVTNILWRNLLIQVNFVSNLSDPVVTVIVVLAGFSFSHGLSCSILPPPRCSESYIHMHHFLHL